ncbi:hypothetical protein PybrP1_013128, partial [[Pythium] brassicae (nom. inval.)]
ASARPFLAAVTSSLASARILEVAKMPAVLQPSGSAGLQLEAQLPPSAQRQLWSALVRLVRLGDRRLVAAARHLALRLLKLQAGRALADTVSCSLARIIVKTTAERGESSEGEDEDDASLAAVQRDAAFRDAMTQLVDASFAVPTKEQLALGGGGSGGDAKQHKVLLRFTRPSQQTAETQQQDGADVADDREPTERTQRKRARVAERADVRGTLQQQEENTEAQVLPPTRAVRLALEVEAKAAKLGKQLSNSEAQASSRALLDDVAKGSVQLIQETINATSATQAETETRLAQLCGLLQLGACSDEALFQITSTLIESNWSSRYASVFLRASVFPKIMAASSVISRVLLQTALLFSERYAGALIESLLVPLLTARTIGPAQGEAATRILRTGVPLEQLDGFLGKSFELAAAKLTSPISSSSGNAAALEVPVTYHFFTNDAALMVLQNVLTMKAPLADATIDSFVACCEAAEEDRAGAAELHKSLKFATLVFTMVSKYADQCAAHAEALEGIGKRLTSLMAKSTMRAILKLKTPS